MGISQAVRNPGTYVSRTVSFYWTLLTDPRRFYDDMIGSRGITREVLFVLVVGLIGTVGNYFVLQTLRPLAEDEGVQLAGDATFALWRMVLGPVIGAVALWVVLTTALYALGWLYSSIGEYFHLLKRAAWALVPLAIANLIYAATALFVAFTLTADDVGPYESTPVQAAETADMVWMEAAAELPMVIGAAVAVVFVAWAGYIAAHAVVDVRDLELSEAYRVAAVPTVAYALYVLYGAFTAFTYTSPF